MKMSTTAAMCAVMVLSACAQTESKPAAIGMPNPASVYCEAHEGVLSIKKDAKGNEYGVCTFKNGQSCDEWAFYRKECTAH